jgi:hypothetical protein
MHKVTTNQRLSPVQAWIKELYALGMRPKMTILAEKCTWDVTEAVLIDRHRSQGVCLLNVGGVL